MPYIPHTDADVGEMLATLNIKAVNTLFDEIPADLNTAALNNIASGMSENQVARHLQQRQPQIMPGGCFIGAGAYEHYIPAAISEIVSRGEFYSAYTPYQAEASQASLQLIYEYQTMMANLMATDVANASLYDGASALAEAILMAVRVKRGKANRILVPANLHPAYRQVLNSILQYQNITLEDIPYNKTTGTLDTAILAKIDANNLAAIVISQPNFFGQIEDVDAIICAAHAFNALVIAQVNPLAMTLLSPPGEWGDRGADIICGEGQPLGVPLASGGPYFGFMCCKQQYLRQLPGRIVGRTEDNKGRRGFVLTLQAREQHIRRAKATSNICTNQGLMVAMATVYMSLMGAQGLHDAAGVSHENAKQLRDKLCQLSGIKLLFNGPMFHEFAIQFNCPVEPIIETLNQQGIQAGYVLKHAFPELGESLLICATETKMPEDIQRYVETIKNSLE